MSLDKIVVLIGSIVGIVLTYWFFLMNKDKESMSHENDHEHMNHEM